MIDFVKDEIVELKFGVSWIRVRVADVNKERITLTDRLDGPIVEGDTIWTYQFYFDVPPIRKITEITTDPINPNYYQMPNGTQLIDVTKWLTSCGGQAVQYIARATRIDQQNKGEMIQDLKKAKWFIETEIDRLSEII